MGITDYINKNHFGGVVQTGLSGVGLKTEWEERN